MTQALVLTSVHAMCRVEWATAHAGVCGVVRPVLIFWGKNSTGNTPGSVVTALTLNGFRVYLRLATTWCTWYS